MRKLRGKPFGMFPGCACYNQRGVQKAARGDNCTCGGLDGTDTFPWMGEAAGEESKAAGEND